MKKGLLLLCAAALLILCSCGEQPETVIKQGTVSVSDTVASSSDYSYLFDSEAKSVTGGDLSTAKVFVFFINQDTEPRMWIADLENLRFYFGFDQFLDDVTRASVAFDLTSEDADTLLALLETAQVNKWDRDYDGNNGETTGSQSWFFSAKLADGSFEQHKGKGIFDGAPAQLSGLRKELIEFTNKHEAE